MKNIIKTPADMIKKKQDKVCAYIFPTLIEIKSRPKPSAILICKIMQLMITYNTRLIHNLYVSHIQGDAHCPKYQPINIVLLYTA